MVEEQPRMFGIGPGWKQIYPCTSQMEDVSTDMLSCIKLTREADQYVL